MEDSVRTFLKTLAPLFVAHRPIHRLVLVWWGGRGPVTAVASEDVLFAVTCTRASFPAKLADAITQ